MQDAKKDAMNGCLVRPSDIASQLDLELYQVCLEDMADAQRSCVCEYGPPDQKRSCFGNVCFRRYNECTARVRRVYSGCMGLVGRQIDIDGTKVIIDEAYCQRKAGLAQRDCDQANRNCLIRLDRLLNPETL